MEETKATEEINENGKDIYEREFYSMKLKEKDEIIERLEEELKSAKSTIESNKSSIEWKDRNLNDYKKEFESIHTALDGLGIQREILNSTSYGSNIMTITARLFAWIAGSKPIIRKED